MADELQKKVLIDVQVSYDEAVTAMANLKTQLQGTKASMSDLKTAFQSAKTTTQEYSAELAKGKVAQQNIKTEIDKVRLSIAELNLKQKEAKQNVQAAAGSYAEASARLAAMGKALKNAEGSFDTTNPKIKAQIEAYNKLNAQLKAYDAQLGNHQRNVGNYGVALQTLTSQLGSLIPGFSKFSTVIETAAQAFDAMGKNGKEASDGANEAEVALSGMTVTGGGLVLALAGIATATASVLYYFSQFKDKQQEVEQFFAGVKNQFANFGKNVLDVFQLKKGANIWNNFKSSFDEGVDVQKQIQQVKNLNEVNDQQIKEMQAQADQYRALAKDVGKSSDDRIKYLKQAQEQENAIIDQQKDNAQQNIEAAINLSDIHKKLSDAEKNALKEGDAYSIARANDFAQAGKITAAGYDMLMGAYGRQTDAMSAANMKLIRQQNDEDKVGKKALDAAEKEKAQLEEIKRATEEAMSERISSMTRMLEFQQEAFGKEISSTDEHYRQLIFKQQQFIEKQEALQNDAKSSPKVKTASANAIKVANDDIAQLRKEQYAESERLLIEHNKKVAQEVQKSALDVKAIQIAGIEDGRKRELATIKLQEDQRKLDLENQNAAAQESIRMLNEEIAAKEKQVNDPKVSAAQKTIYENELQALRTSLLGQEALLSDNADKAAAYQKQSERAIDKANKKYDIQNKLLQDHIALVKDAENVKGKGPYSAAVRQQEANELQQNSDEETKAIQDAGLEGSNTELTEDAIKSDVKLTRDQQTQKLAIVNDFEKQKKAIEAAFRKDKLSADLNVAQTVAQTSLEILKDSIASASQARQVQLENDKNNDLKNTSLTTTQREIIEDQYRKKEGQAKVKAFKEDQELQIAQAIMNGAVAVTKTFAETGALGFATVGPIIAETAAQVAKIESEKPPAYATGGIHYNSDGRGGVLPGYSKTDDTNAHLRSGEGILVSEAMQNPWARAMASAINQSFGGRPFSATTSVKTGKPRFAAGGMFTTYTPTTDNGLRPTPVSSSSPGPVRLHADDINSIVQGLTNAVSNIPAPYVVADIKDINAAQQTKANNQARVNL